MIEEKKKLRQHWNAGRIIQIDLDNKYIGFGLVLTPPQVAFYDYRVDKNDLSADIETIKKQPILFKTSVFKQCVTQHWPYIGKTDYDPKLNLYKNKFAYDAGKKLYYIWTTQAQKILSTWEECKDLEESGIFDYGIVEQRLRDHFAGRPCYFIEYNKPNWRKISAKEFYKQYGYDFTVLDD